jgi:hypothetical protein
LVASRTSKSRGQRKGFTEEIRGTLKVTCPNKEGVGRSRIRRLKAYALLGEQPQREVIICVKQFVENRLESLGRRYKRQIEKRAGIECLRNQKPARFLVKCDIWDPILTHVVLCFRTNMPNPFDNKDSL